MSFARSDPFGIVTRAVDAGTSEPVARCVVGCAGEARVGCVGEADAAATEVVGAEGKLVADGLVAAPHEISRTAVAATARDPIHDVTRL